MRSARWLFISTSLVCLAVALGAGQAGAQAKREPARPEDWIARAAEASSKSDWLEVIRMSSVAIDANARSPEAYVLRSQAFLNIGMLDKADKDITAALQIDPANIYALNNKGVFLRETGRRGEAEVKFYKACAAGLELACSNYVNMFGYHPSEKPQKLIEMSVVAFNQGDWDNVIRLTSDAIALNPNLPYAYINRSGAQTEKGLWEEAIKDANAAIQLNPDIGLAYSNKAAALELCGDPSDIALNYRIACRLGTPGACAKAERPIAQIAAGQCRKPGKLPSAEIPKSPEMAPADPPVEAKVPPAAAPPSVQVPALPAAEPKKPEGVEIALVKEKGVFTIPVNINNVVEIHCILDSGASSLVIPDDVFLTLIRAGTIKKEDLLGDATFTIADGSQMKATRFRIRSLRIGSKVVEDIEAATTSVRGDILLGQSVLNRFSAWSIDNKRGVLVIQ